MPKRIVPLLLASIILAMVGIAPIGGAGIAGAAPHSVFAALPETFTFASGAGGWWTEVHINPDGTFTGLYTDGNMGDYGEDYPNGSMDECYFSGAFKDLVQVGDFEYSMRIDFLATEGVEGEARIVDGVRIITSTPYGFDDADEFRLYLPGMRIADLSDDYMSWIGWPLQQTTQDNTLPTAMPFYGLYNVGGRQGFYSDVMPPASARAASAPAASSSHIIGTVTVTHSKSVVIRNRPSEEGNNLLRINPGKSLPCVGLDASGWYKVYHEGYIGYVPGNQVQFAAQAMQASHSEALLGVVEITSNDFVNVRSEPNQNSEWLGGISPGVTLDCVDIAQNGWYCVLLPSGEIGYISNKLCEKRFE